MKTLYQLGALICVILGFASSIFAQNLNWIEAPNGVHPIIDGACTYVMEWDSANFWVNSDSGKRGAICREYQNDWIATSSIGNVTVYSGVTLFEVHDFWEAKSYEAEDLNKFGWKIAPTLNNPDTILVAWVFDLDSNAVNDSAWFRAENAAGLWASHLIPEPGCSGSDLVDDRGFIVRLNNDPMSDVHWFPGDPEPGDPIWKWADYYGFFGTFGFNDSSRTLNALWTNDYWTFWHTSVPNEVYEFALHGGIGGNEPESTAYQPCIHTFRKIHHFDPHSGRNEYTYITVIDGPGHISAPRPRPKLWPPLQGIPPQPNLNQGPPANQGGNAPGNIETLPIIVWNISDTTDEFILTAIDDNGWLEEPFILGRDIAGNSASLFQIEFTIPPEAEIGMTNRFYISAYAMSNPDFVDEVNAYYPVVDSTKHLIWLPPEVSSSSALAIQEMINANGRSVSMTEDSLPLEGLTDYDVIWITLGMSPTNYILEDGSPEVIALSNYLESGGSIYMEGGNTWLDDIPTTLHSFFHIEPLDNETDDLAKVMGYNMLNGYNFSYEGGTNSVDFIRPQDPNATLLFFDSDAGSGLGVAYAEEDLYTTIGTSFEFGGLMDASSSLFGKYELMDALLYFLEGKVESGIEIEKHDFTPEVYALFQNYPNPFNSITTFRYNLRQTSHVTLKVYDIIGREVATLLDRYQSAGHHTATWNAENIASGIYFYQITAGEFKDTKKCIILK